MDSKMILKKLSFCFPSKEKNQEKFLILSITAIVAFCSMIYELILAQFLAAIMGSTIKQYSLTVGLYLFSLGVGSLIFFLKGNILKLKDLFFVELALCILGGLLPFLSIGGDFLFRLCAKNFSNSSIESWQTLYQCCLILVIGILSGLELPMLMEWARRFKNGGLKVLGVDYFFTFVASVVFPLWFVYDIGLLGSCLIVSFLNIFVSFLLYWHNRALISKKWLLLLCLVFLLMLLESFYLEAIHQLFYEMMTWKNL